MADFLLPDDAEAGNAALLKALRIKRASELRHNLEMRGPNFMTGGTPGDYAELQSDIHNDPDTGDEAEAATALREKQLANESAFLSPGAQEVRDVQQQDALARALAVPRLQGQTAMDLERLKQEGQSRLLDQQHDFTRELVRGNAPNELGGQGFTPSINAAGGVTLRGNAPKKPTTEEQRVLDTGKAASDLFNDYFPLMEKQYPGVSVDPTKYGGTLDTLGSWLGAKAYGAGLVHDVNQDHLDQLTGFFEGTLNRIYTAGRINKDLYNDLKKHVPQLGLSAGANYTRAKYIYDRLLPVMHEAVGTSPGSMGGGDPYADPNYQPR